MRISRPTWLTWRATYRGAVLGLLLIIAAEAHFARQEAAAAASDAYDANEAATAARDAASAVQEKLGA